MKKLFPCILFVLSVLLSACGKHGATDGASALNEKSAQVEDSPAPAPDEETSAFIDCSTAYKSAGDIKPSENGLRLVRSFTECAENYLSRYPQGAHVADMETVRYYSIVGAMEILKELDKHTETDGAENVRDIQKGLVSQKNIDEMRSANVNAISRAFDDQNINIAWQLFNKLKLAGVTMEDVQGSLNSSNVNRQRTGVWELVVDRSYDNNKFIVVRDMNRTSPMFEVSGFGATGPNVFIVDDGWEERGWLSTDCIARVSMRNPIDYSCADYLSGAASAKILDDISNALTAEMKEKEASPK